jgi:outer membrane receptor protein involved in Fe transport
MKGNSTPRQPKWSGFATMTWETILFDRESYLRGDWLYTGEQYVDESNLAYLDDYSIVNVRFGMNINDQWLAELFVSNLFDEEAWMSGARRTDFARPTQLALLTNFQGVNVVPLDKREIGLRVNFKF